MQAEGSTLNQQENSNLQSNDQPNNNLVQITALSFQQFCLEIKNGAVILDTRSEVDQGVINGAINIFVSQQFSVWVSALIEPNQRLVLVTDPGKELDVIQNLNSFGYSQICGYLEGGFDNYLGNGGQIGTVKIVPLENFLDYEGQPDKHILLDVRKPEEFQSGYLPGAINIGLSVLREQVENIPKNKIIHIYCRSGARAKTALTILRNYGFNDFVILKQGGYSEICKANQIVTD